MVFKSILGIFSFVYFSFACHSDSDCSSNTPYCVSGQCVYLAEAGGYCQSSTDCAAFSVLGDQACTASCDMSTAECMTPLPPFSLSNIPYGQRTCCQSLSLNQPCFFRTNVNLCSSGLICNQSSSNTNILTCQAPAVQQGGVNWIIGVAIALGSSVILNIGMNIQKYAFKEMEKRPETSHMNPFRNLLWVIGFAMFMLGNIGNFIALNFAAQSLIAPLGAVALVSNTIAAPLINKEPLTKLDILAVVLIIVGSVIVVLNSNHADTAYSLCTLQKLYLYPATIIFLVIIFILITGFAFFIGVMQLPLIDASQGPPPASRWWAVRQLQKVQEKQQALAKRLTSNPHGFAVRFMMPFSYATEGGIMGGITVMFAKSCAQILSTTIQNQTPALFLQFYTYVALVGLAVTAVGQVYYINMGLKFYDALLQVPVFYVIYTVCGVVAGGIYFQEFSAFDVETGTGFFGGILSIFAGVAFLTGRLKGAVKPPNPTGLEEKGDAHKLPNEHPAIENIINVEEHLPEIIPVPKTASVQGIVGSLSERVELGKDDSDRASSIWEKRARLPPEMSQSFSSADDTSSVDRRSWRAEDPPRSAAARSMKSRLSETTHPSMNESVVDGTPNTLSTKLTDRETDLINMLSPLPCEDPSDPSQTNANSSTLTPPLKLTEDNPFFMPSNTFNVDSSAPTEGVSSPRGAPSLIAVVGSPHQRSTSLSSPTHAKPSPIVTADPFLSPQTPIPVTSRDNAMLQLKWETRMKGENVSTSFNTSVPVLNLSMFFDKPSPQSPKHAMASTESLPTTPPDSGGQFFQNQGNNANTLPTKRFLQRHSTLTSQPNSPSFAKPTSKPPDPKL